MQDKQFKTVPVSKELSVGMKNAPTQIPIRIKTLKNQNLKEIE